MKTFARLSIFETNSSSCHQIVINNDGEYKVPEVLEIHTGEYGWDFNVLRTVEERVSYLVTVIMYICSYPRDKYNEQWFDEMYSKLNSKLDEFGVKLIEDPEYGTDFWAENNPHHYNGYVDHPDWYIDRIEEIINDDKLLYDFLFNGHSFVVIGNDNGYTSFDAPEDWSMDDELKKEVW